MNNNTYTHSPYIDDCTIRNLECLDRRDDILAVIQYMEIINEAFMDLDVNFNLTVPVENKVNENLATEIYLVMTNTRLNLVSRNVFKSAREVRLYLAQLNKLGLVI